VADECGPHAAKVDEAGLRHLLTGFKKPHSKATTTEADYQLDTLAAEVYTEFSRPTLLSTPNCDQNSPVLLENRSKRG